MSQTIVLHVKICKTDSSQKFQAKYFKVFFKVQQKILSVNQ